MIREPRDIEVESEVFSIVLYYKGGVTPRFLKSTAMETKRFTESEYYRAVKSLIRQSKIHIVAAGFYIGAGALEMRTNDSN